MTGRSEKEFIKSVVESDQIPLASSDAVLTPDVGAGPSVTSDQIMALQQLVASDSAILSCPSEHVVFFFGGASLASDFEG